MLYLIAYDIADSRRLQRVGRLMDKRAMRCQKSVFLAYGDAADQTIEQILDEASLLMKHDEDIIQAWKLAKDQTLQGFSRGAQLNLDPPAVVLGKHALLM